MAEADFEIDFYGDAGNDQQRSQEHDDDRHQENDSRYRDDSHSHGDERVDDHRHAGGRRESDSEEVPPHQGVKRKSEELSDRPVDNGATAAIMISELNWWTTDDDIRGWLQKADCEGEIKELTFSEHKVNGKSKGQAYVEFDTRQAATAAKRYIDQLDSNQPGQKKITTSYWNPGVNPFRTLPKDAPARVKEQPRAAPSGSYPDRGSFSGGGFRGRGGMNSGRGFQGMNPSFGGNFGFGQNQGGNSGGGGDWGNPHGAKRPRPE
ncbi:hypothetical protein PT974_01287 [Cladobotryum mycophilum]|uniref:RRM domain-containing protein n=1 Tax=Cladobotryum mycophilum TaxID=491253 RepID=A0ABR0T380_9HYPO